MLRRLTLSSIIVLTALTSACGDREAQVTEVKIEEPAIDPLTAAVANPERDTARDQFRNPQETLEFFGVEPGSRIAEIWGGYYTEILAPYARDTDGTHVAVLFPETSERMIQRVADFKSKYGDVEKYGEIEYGTFGYDADGNRQGQIAPDESLDMVLTFRNIHSFMGRGYVDQAFQDFYTALKPGGTLGVVQHRLPETAVQDPAGSTGYVQESYIKDLAARAGFEFVASSEVNANPLDTADHPFGVWTLPPRSRVPEADDPRAEEFEAELYRNIGESDRATLKFRKPA